MRLQRRSLPPLYALTAPVEGLAVLQVVERLVSGGARWIQLREKNADGASLYRDAHGLVSSLPASVRLFVNDRADIAIASDADGVHVGEHDLPPAAIRRLAGSDELIIGYSTHSIEEARAAIDDPTIDYLAIGPIFESSTKTVREPHGLSVIAVLRELTEKPIVAIGGIDEKNIASVLEAGADSAAVIAALYRGGNIEVNVGALLDAAGSAKR